MVGNRMVGVGRSEIKCDVPTEEMALEEGGQRKWNESRGNIRRAWVGFQIRVFAAWSRPEVFGPLHMPE